MVAGTPIPKLDAQIVGQPAGVTGRVTGDDVLGATVVVQIPAAVLPPVPDAPTTTTGAAGARRRRPTPGRSCRRSRWTPPARTP